MSSHLAGLRLLVAAGAGLLAGACQPQTAATGGLQPCTTLYDCPAGDVCRGGTCVADGRPDHCGITGCPSGELCGADGNCRSLDDGCAAVGGCHCEALGMHGEASLDGAPPVLVAPPGGRLQPRLALLGAGGERLPHVGVAIDLGEAGALFDAAGESVVAGAAGGEGEASLSPLAGVHCPVRLRSLGAMPPGGALRALVYDAASGSPVGGAELVLAAAGEAATARATTDAAGVAVWPAAPAGAFDVHAFAAGHDHLSLLRLDGGTTELALPLPPRPGAAAGVAGSADFDAYEARVLGDAAWPLRVGLAGLSGRLTGLMEADLDLLQRLAACADEATDGPGCYSLPDVPGRVPLPGGLLLSFGTKVPIKPTFAVAGRPGRRTAWLLAAELRPRTIAAMRAAAVGLFAGGAGGEDASGLLAEQIVGFLPHVAVASQPLWLTAAPATSLHAGPGDAHYARLTGSGALVPEAPLRGFTALRLPLLPDSDEIDAALVVHGAEVPGSGFVPLGLGLGLDCTRGDCLRGGSFDRQVNGIALCPDGLCPPGTPARTVDGTVPLFFATPPAALAGHPRRTVALATSLRTLGGSDDEGTVLAGLVRPHAPQPGTDESLAEAAFGVPPPPLGPLQGRRLQLPPLPGGELSWVRLELADGAAWHVYAAGGAATFVAPPVPAGRPDLPADGELQARHLAVGLERGAEGPGRGGLSELVGHGGVRLGRLDEAVRHFGLRRRAVAVEGADGQ